MVYSHASTLWCLLKITQPEFIVGVAKAGCVILPVAEKLQFTTLTSEENLEKNSKRWLISCMWNIWKVQPLHMSFQKSFNLKSLKYSGYILSLHRGTVREMNHICNLHSTYSFLTDILLQAELGLLLQMVLSHIHLSVLVCLRGLFLDHYSLHYT